MERSPSKSASTESGAPGAGSAKAEGASRTLSDTLSDSPTHDADPYLVGIGASAGGLEALEEFFDATPPDCGMAFIVVQHLSPDFKSLMDELLARHTKMPIQQVADGMQPQANQIYLNPAKRNLRIEAGKLRLTTLAPDGGLNLPIDNFFKSLAEEAGERAVAVILSGTGSDGSHSLRNITEAGGLVVVQDPESARFDGMPVNAVETGFVDVVTSPGKMATEILRYSRDPAGFRESKAAEAKSEEDEAAPIEYVLSTFRRKFGIDFSYYRQSTIVRRLERRVQLTQQKDLESYVERLKTDAQEVEALYRDLLVEVTEFFRDKEAFLELEKDVIPEMIRKAEPGSTLRVWVPGCATGEEAYSLAMLFDHCARQEGSDVEFRLFATDVHRDSLEFASTGIYSEASAENLSEPFRSRYLVHKNGLYHIAQSLRSKVIFAPHDVTSGPPFTRIDLVSCRNLLIYLESPVQQRVLALFHFALKVGGVLFLGGSESLADLKSEFDVINGHWRIFRKLRDVRLAAASLSLSPPIDSVIHPRPAFATVVGHLHSSEDGAGTGPVFPHVSESLLRKYLPPSLVVNTQHELVHSYGDAGKLLTPPEGKPTHSVLKMVDGDLRMAMSAALHKASELGSQVVYNGVRLGESIDAGLVRMSVDPYQEKGQHFFLISLEPMEAPGRPVAELGDDVADEAKQEGVTFDRDDHSGAQLKVLERELEYTRESLQATVEELETSNEELQSTNEELIASNEELQSTKEELQSVNEELYTVNAEHQRKISELTELTADMDNLLRSTDVGTIYLDYDLKIRKFTPAIASAFHVLEQDIGRPIEHIANNLDHPELLIDVRRALSTDSAVEREVRSQLGVTYLMRIQPYHSQSGRVAGVVLTCVDVTAIKASYEEIRRAAARQEVTDHDLQEFAYAVSHDLQAPLRHIADHVGRLITTPPGKDGERRLGNKEVYSLEVLELSSQRLQEMTQNLLSYSRVVARGNPFENVDLNQLLDDVLEVMHEQLQASGAELKRDPLPSIEVDTLQMTLVFKAIIDNSIKYCERVPELHIGAYFDDDADEWVIYFSDNGIGIRPQHLERIFVIFQRLGFVEAPGAGVGLALCKRIIQRHGGRIRAESRLDEGSTFSIHLPKDQKKPVKL